MQGKIIKGISGFYYVHVVEAGIYECKAKGAFRQQKIKPLVGDDVEIDVISEENRIGNVIKIQSRMSELIRPAVANVNQALLIFAAASPEPNFNLMDRFLVTMAYQHVPVIICFNKCDLVTDGRMKALSCIYEKSNCKVMFASAKKEIGLEELEEVLADKTTTVAGPSGVGKSSLINLLAPDACMETGEISKKIERGRHTTRHSQLICLHDNSYIMDTPGFSSMYLPEMEKEELQGYFPEINRYEPQCRFQGCSHISEPDCGVKEAMAQGLIHPMRYENYCMLYQEIKDNRRY